jgi:murein DD-endopeptidase MepM/ murein hydrolase activator NlpD
LATDIFAPVGSVFVAVTSGVIQGVSRADEWNPDVDDGATRGGLFVALLGDDGVRYYGSHLSTVAEGIAAGVRVTAGQPLGEVGVSGSARDTPPHLHFGISRPTPLQDWEVRRGEVDPVPYLDAWRAGDTTATPILPTSP